MREQWSCRVAVGSAVCAAVLGASVAAARADVALTYLDPGPAAVCPSPAEVEAAMRAELPDADFADDGTTTVIGRIAVVAGRYRGELTIVGPGQPAQTQTFADADCAVVTDALVVALARYQHGHPAAVARPAAPATVQPRIRPTGEAIFALGVTTGVFDNVAPGGSFGGESLHGDWSWGGRVALVSGTGAGEQFLLAGSLDACVRTPNLFGCTLIGLGRLDAHQVTELYGFLGGRAGLELPLGRRAALSPAIELHVSTNDTDDQSFGVRRVSGTISLGFLFYVTPAAHPPPP